MNKNLTKIVGWTVNVAVLIMLAAGVCLAQFEKRGVGRLVGTWDAVVTLRNCNTGDAIRTFASIGTFMQGGTSIGSTSGLPQSSRTPEHGVWAHITGNTYMFRFKSFSFDAAGSPTGWTVVTHQIELAADANTYTSGGIAQIFLPNGVQVAQGCSTAIATRFAL